MTEKFVPTYRWKLSDLEKVEKNGLKVFSCFACGGGSTMGYKLAGFEVIGANDIDPEMAWHYKTNHNPKYYFLEDIRKFKERKDLPEELYNLDILDGSPPCSSFSMAGAREKGWGEKKQFREGQAHQILDDLFFEFIDLGNKLRPKVIIAENVKGMLIGNAKGYVKQIIQLYNTIGYDVQLFLLNAASMGVPQKRERVFFICSRKDLKLPKLNLFFNQKPITLGEAIADCIDEKGKDCTGSSLKKYYDVCRPGKSLSSTNAKGSYFNWYKLNKNEVCPTLTATGAQTNLLRWDTMHCLSDKQVCLLGSYPLDYKFKSPPGYMVGMSVPPLMTYGIASQIKNQWFK